MLMTVPMATASRRSPIASETPAADTSNRVTTPRNCATSIWRAERGGGGVSRLGPNCASRAAASDELSPTALTPSRARTSVLERTCQSALGLAGNSGPVDAGAVEPWRATPQSSELAACAVPHDLDASFGNSRTGQAPRQLRVETWVHGFGAAARWGLFR